MAEYQVMLLGPNRRTHGPDLNGAITDQLVALGIQPDFVDRLTSADAGAIKWTGVTGIPVAVWFGQHKPTLGYDPDDAKDLAAVGQFLLHNAPIFPVSDDATTPFKEWVPTVLEPINGMGWDAAQLASGVLRALRLMRDQRRTFISYRRDESTGVARQLFAELAHLGQRPFLDTASIDPGVDFQESLWCRMADVDLLIFLDTPNATASRWVQQELTRAQHMGLGVLQVVWPRHAPSAVTNFCFRHDLIDTDLLRLYPTEPPVLDPRALKEVLSKAERARVKSLWSRRQRVVGDVVDQVTDKGYKTAVSPTGHISVLHSDDKLHKEIVTAIGLPDAIAIQEAETANPVRSGKWINSCLAFDGAALTRRGREHLRWINQRKDGLMSMDVSDVGDWL